MKSKSLNYLYIITIVFFGLGFFNIIFGWLGFICLILPFVLLYKDRKKTWCQGYCPRSSLFQNAFHGKSLIKKAAPSWLTKGRTKWFVLGYFCINLFILTMSTIMVSRGVRAPLERIRFLLLFQIPWNIPQILDFGSIPGWVVHLSFRVYSMMFTTTVIGLVLAGIFKPRTWCTICPVNTISDLALSKIKTKADIEIKRKGVV
ncbi:4Fe-4S binding protein [Youngiibacter fragilis]|uniref:4Fe-4S ferredoxin-type domain-containing protein n=1 Tax=Youngiibacter fragilis 232.1 TaxID=994573 RepID=V7I6M4_9CLOT|nr:4Fe-4S binding protein [Youngiibacter fragilis]ETA80946.1 hypothetical protein T472_0209175 [Youngiibacter fragilis 232.1]